MSPNEEAVNAPHRCKYCLESHDGCCTSECVLKMNPDYPNGTREPLALLADKILVAVLTWNDSVEEKRKRVMNILAVSATSKLVEIEEALREYQDSTNYGQPVDIAKNIFLADVRSIVEKKG